MNLSNLEKTVLAIVRFNEENPPGYIFKKQYENKYFKFKIDWRSSKNLWGRFGAGWNWKIGIQFSKKSYIVSLLVLEICLYIK